MDARDFNLDRLNEQQLLMLRLLKNPMPEASFRELKQLVVALLTKEIDGNIEAWEQENNITLEYYETLSKQHFRSSLRKP